MYRLKNAIRVIFSYKKGVLSGRPSFAYHILVYVRQRTDGNALSAGACGVDVQIVQHLLMVEVLQILAVQITAFEPVGKGANRACVHAELAAIALKAHADRTVVGTGGLKFGRSQQGTVPDG